MKKIYFLLTLFVFNIKALDRGTFYKHNNGWVYTGSEMSRIVRTLSSVKEKISAISTRTQVESTFRDVFLQAYDAPDEEEYRNTAFAWTQACLKRTKNPVAGIEREIGWIQENKRKNLGIFINHRPSNWSGLNWIWNFSKEEKQKPTVDGDIKNMTWEVDVYGKEKNSCIVQ